MKQCNLSTHKITCISAYCINRSTLVQIIPSSLVSFSLFTKEHWFLAMWHASVGSDVIWDEVKVERHELLSKHYEVQPCPSRVLPLPRVDIMEVTQCPWKQKARSCWQHVWQADLPVVPHSSLLGPCFMFPVTYFWLGPSWLLPFSSFERWYEAL